MNAIFKPLQQLFTELTPAHCVLCKKPTGRGLSLCRTCEKDFRRNTTACKSCARPLEQAHNNICGECQQHAPYFDATLAPFIYEEPFKELIIGLKFHEKLLKAKILASLFSNHIQSENLPDLLIPVPLHPSRLRERGYNQSLELAKELSTTLNITYDYKSCTRHINTARQSELPMDQKKSNVRGAFSCNRKFDRQHIAIVDDVMTSGHTVNEFARVLKKSGAGKVDIWVMARAGKGSY